jgi:hypothetical protein
MILTRVQTERDALQIELERLREGLRRLKDHDYDMRYTPASYAEAILLGHEPQGGMKND